jgi:hypothetical protein
VTLTEEPGGADTSSMAEANWLVRADAPASLAAVPVRVERLVSVGFVVAVVAVAVQTLGHLTNSLVLDYRVYNLDADVDGNMLAWASSAATFTAGLFAVLSAFVLEAQKRLLLALGAVLVLFSADDIVALHEHLGQWVVRLVDVDVDYGRLIWPPLYLPLLLYVVLVLGNLALKGPEEARRPLKVGLVCLLAAVPAEMLWALWLVAAGDIRTTGDAIEVAVEEGLELGGWILIATGMAAVALTGFLRSEQAT